MRRVETLGCDKLCYTLSMPPLYLYRSVGIPLLGCIHFPPDDGEVFLKKRKSFLHRQIISCREKRNDLPAIIVFSLVRRRRAKNKTIKKKKKLPGENPRPETGSESAVRKANWSTNFSRNRPFFHKNPQLGT